jgi:hypothetical protein
MVYWNLVVSPTSVQVEVNGRVVISESVKVIGGKNFRVGRLTWSTRSVSCDEINNLRERLLQMIREESDTPLYRRLGGMAKREIVSDRALNALAA